MPVAAEIAINDSSFGAKPVTQGRKSRSSTPVLASAVEETAIAKSFCNCHRYRFGQWRSFDGRRACKGNRAAALVEYAQAAINSGLIDVPAGRTTNTCCCIEPQHHWSPSFCWHCPCPPPPTQRKHIRARIRKRDAKPKRYKTAAEHFKTCHELASAGQFYRQGDHHTPRLMPARRFANTSNAASLRMALPKLGW